MHDTFCCPGKCNAGWRAAEQRYENNGTPNDLDFVEGQPVWCPPCTTAIRAALADMPDLAHRLQEEIESGVSAAMTEYVSGSKNRPVHDHEAASFLLDEFAEWATSWEDTMRSELGLPGRTGAPGQWTAIVRACGFMLPHLNWQLAERVPEPYGAEVSTDFGLDVLRYHRRAQFLTGTQDPEPVRVAGVPCPMCDYKALEHEVEGDTGHRIRAVRYRYGDGGNVLSGRDDTTGALVKLTETITISTQGAVLGYIRCRRCRPTFRMAPDEYHAWTKLLAAGDEVRALATQEKLAEIFGGSVPTQYRAVR